MRIKKKKKKKLPLELRPELGETVLRLVESAAESVLGRVALNRLCLALAAVSLRGPGGAAGLVARVLADGERGTPAGVRPLCVKERSCSCSRETRVRGTRDERRLTHFRLLRERERE